MGVFLDPIAQMVVLKKSEIFSTTMGPSNPKKNHPSTTRWAPTIYKWTYNPYKWPYKWVTGVITLLIGVITPVITGRGPTLNKSKEKWVS